MLVFFPVKKPFFFPPENKNFLLEQLGTDTANRGVLLELNATSQDCTVPICKQDVNFSGSGTFYDVLNINGELNNHMNITCNVDNPITGIRIRCRPPRTQPDVEKSMPQAQGNASRRLRLQRKLQVHSLNRGNAINNWNSEEKGDESKPVVTKVRSL